MGLVVCDCKVIELHKVMNHAFQEFSGLGVDSMQRIVYIAQNGSALLALLFHPPHQLK